MGVTLFSMFFGAGNLILAPLLGVQAASQTPLATLGFLISAVGLPVLTIAAIALSGTVRDLVDRINPFFSEVFAAAVYLAIGPFLAIPRTATTSFEMVRPLLGDAGNAPMALAAFSVAFFTLAFALALRPSRLTELMGRLSGPSLVALIVLLVGACVVSPPGTVAPAVGKGYVANAGVAGFVCGYQTMDVLASLAFGLVIALNVRELGLSDPTDVARQVIRSGAVAGVILALIYCGLSYLGFSMGSVMPDAANGAAVIAAAAAIEFGGVGSVLVAVIFALACLNVCIGLICSIGAYFAERYDRLSYRQWALAITLVSLGLSNFGLTTILGYSVPLLSALYPVAICIAVMGLVQRGGGNAWAWRLAVGLCAIDSVAVALRDGFAPKLELPLLDQLPLADLSMGWVLPAVAGFALGLVVERVVTSRTAAAR